MTKLILVLVAYAALLLIDAAAVILSADVFGKDLTLVQGAIVGVALRHFMGFWNSNNQAPVTNNVTNITEAPLSSGSDPILQAKIMAERWKHKGA